MTQVLHVDDDPAITDLTGTVLEREDDRFVVETATSADGRLLYDCSPAGHLTCLTPSGIITSKNPPAAFFY